MKQVHKKCTSNTLPIKVIHYSQNCLFTKVVLTTFYPLQYVPGIYCWLLKTQHAWQVLSANKEHRGQFLTALGNFVVLLLSGVIYMFKYMTRIVTSAFWHAAPIGSDNKCHSCTAEGGLTSN